VDVDTTLCWIPSRAAIDLPASSAAILVCQGRPGNRPVRVPAQPL
jgi:hypothetical protein